MEFDVRPLDGGSRGGGDRSVSAVIPACNAAETIERALSSVYSQTYDYITEVIVVDDGSVDHTARVVGKAFPQATIVRQDNTGDAGARNAGIQRATGAYVAFLDADDEWVPDKLTVQMDVMKRYPGLDVLTCHMAIDRGTGTGSRRVSRIAGNAHVNMTQFVDWLCWFAPPSGHIMLPNASGLLIRRGLFDEIGYMDATLAGSVEFVIRAAGLGHSVGVVGAPLSIIYEVDGSVSRSSTGMVKVASLACSIISRYDPSGTSWESGLLTLEQFASAMSAACAFGSKWAYDAGDRSLSASYLARALRYGGHGRLRYWMLRFGAANPCAYYSLYELRDRLASIRSAAPGGGDR